MEYERCLINYAEPNETLNQSFFFENENNQNEKGFLEDSFEKNINMMNPSFNITSNTTLNNVPNVSSNNDSNINLNNTTSNEYTNCSINITSNEYNTLSINSKEEKEEGEITDVCVDIQVKKKEEKGDKKKRRKR